MLKHRSNIGVAFLLGLLSFPFVSCFEDKETIDEKYKEWRTENMEYVIAEGKRLNDDGTPYYEKIVPSWAPNTYVLVHWHNDRSETASNLSPMDNSTTQITYELFNINNVRISDSFSYTDSVYTSKPSTNIIGMWAALVNMNVGDSVSMVIPSEAGYGIKTYGDIIPYTTLLYNVKLKAVTAYEVP